MVLHNYQNLIVMTSNIIYTVAFCGGFKCPHKIHLITQWTPPPLLFTPSAFPVNSPHPCKKICNICSFDGSPLVSQVVIYLWKNVSGKMLIQFFANLISIFLIIPAILGIVSSFLDYYFSYYISRIVITFLRNLKSSAFFKNDSQIIFTFLWCFCRMPMT